MNQVHKINFARKKSGGGRNWGAGLDYLLKDCWDKFDELTKENYYGRHNRKLIDFLFRKAKTALGKSVEEMKKACKKGPGLDDWMIKEKNIQKSALLSNSLSNKAIFVDIVSQFLRETSAKDLLSRRFLSLKKVPKILSSLGTFKGVVAYGTGVIKGTARIIMEAADFSKLKKKEILVTDETDASFLPIMKKAGAFITDTGGILCHAAIIAREMKKPCIVGTKIATKVLKTGDLVEVDANKGIIKILEKYGK